MCLFCSLAEESLQSPHPAALCGGGGSRVSVETLKPGKHGQDQLLFAGCLPRAKLLAKGFSSLFFISFSPFSLLLSPFCRDSSENQSSQPFSMCGF